MPSRAQAVDDRPAIGLDLGGTQVRAALVRSGQVLRRVAAPTDVTGGPEAVLSQFRELVASICNADEFEDVAAVGLAAPGPLDTVSGVVEAIPTLPRWEQFPIRDRLRAEFDRPVVVENDAVAAAFGEWQHGAGVGLDHLVYVTVSTGIGGGVVVDGRLIHGRRGMAAHVGHFRIVPDGPRCSCGTLGCFEATASGTALDTRARARAKDNPTGFLGSRAAEKSADGHDVVEGARAGDPDCVALLNEEADYLGVGFTGLIHMFSPDVLIMGGGVVNAFELLSERIHAVIRRDALAPFKGVPVVPAMLGDNSGLIGSASLALKNGCP